MCARGGAARARLNSSAPAGCTHAAVCTRRSYVQHTYVVAFRLTIFGDVHTICSHTHATHQPQPFDELLTQSCHCRVDKVFRASGGKSQDRCFTLPFPPYRPCVRIWLSCARSDFKLSNFLCGREDRCCVCLVRPRFRRIYFGGSPPD